MPINKKVILATSLLIASSANAFTTQSSTASRTITSLNAVNDNDQQSERRTFLRNIAGVAFGGTMGMMLNEEPASASYSAYTNREKDWQDRKESGGKDAQIAY